MYKILWNVFEIKKFHFVFYHTLCIILSNKGGLIEAKY